MRIGSRATTAMLRVAYTAQWNDDFHHVAHHLLTGRAHGYYADYAQRAARVARSMPRGRLRVPGRGVAAIASTSSAASRARICLPTRSSTSCRTTTRSAIAPSASACTRWRRPPSLRSLLRDLPARALDPAAVHGRGVRGRYAVPLLRRLRRRSRQRRARWPTRRVRRVSAVRRRGQANSIPDPGADSTVVQSRLRWESIAREPHAAWLRLYRELLALRAQRIVPIVDGIVAGESRYHAGDKALDVVWRMRDERTLHLALRLVRDAPLRDARSDVIWRSRPDDAWTVRWTIGHD